MESTLANKQIKFGAILSYCQMGLNIIIGLLYVPIMIKLLGKSEYGLYNAIVSTVSMLSILNLGFSSGYIRYYAKYKSVNDENAIRKLNGLYLIVFLVIGLIAFLCGFYLTQHLDLIFDKGLTDQEYRTARILMLFLTINLAVSFPMSVFSVIINAHERFVFAKIIDMIKSVLNPILSIPLLFLGYGSIGIVIITLGTSFLADCVFAYYVFVKLKNRFIFKDFEEGIFFSLFSYISFIAINIVIDQVNWNIDKVLLGRFKGTVEVAVYSVGALFQRYYMIFSVAISSLFVPKIHHIVNNVSGKERDAFLTDLFIRVGRFQFLVLSLVISSFVFFGKLFISYWAGTEYSEAYYVALLFLIPLTVPLIQNLGIEIQRAENKHKYRSIIYSVMAVINLLLTVVLCQKYGAIGAAVGTAISLVVANGLIMNMYYNNHCGLNISLFWKNIFHMSAGLVIPLLCGCLILYMTHINNFITMFFWIVIYSSIYMVSMWCLGLNEYEKNIIINLAGGVLSKQND